MEFRRGDRVKVRLVNGMEFEGRYDRPSKLYYAAHIVRADSGALIMVSRVDSMEKAGEENQNGR